MKKVLKISSFVFLAIVVTIPLIFSTIYIIYDAPLANIISKGYIFGDESKTGYNAWPTVINVQGKIYCTFSGYRERHLFSDGKICLAVSDENNINFDTKVIYDSELDERDPGILYLGNGKFMVTFLTYEGLNQKYLSHYILSEDYCQTWSEPYDIELHSPHGPTMLDNGNIVYLGHNIETTDFYAMISNDCGQTWQRGTSVPIPSDVNKKYLFEPYAIQLNDGSIFGSIKYLAPNSNKYFDKTFFFTKSYDGGQTWTELEYSGIYGIPPHMIQLSTGEIILSYGRRTYPYSLRYIVSMDNGKTFSKEKKLTNQFNWDFGYPSTCELSNGTLLSVWYGKNNYFQKNNYIYYINWNL